MAFCLESHQVLFTIASCQNHRRNLTVLVCDGTVAGDDTNLGAFPLNSFLPDHTDEFYRYEGSLTTPQCQETVIWTIFTNTIQISEKQVTDTNPILFCNLWLNPGNVKKI